MSDYPDVATENAPDDEPDSGEVEDGTATVITPATEGDIDNMPDAPDPLEDDDEYTDENADEGDDDDQDDDEVT